jgi:hypothetical protein
MTGPAPGIPAMMLFMAEEARSGPGGQAQPVQVLAAHALKTASALMTFGD